MKIIVTGAKGQLGTDLVRELNKRGHEVIGTDIDTLDITDKEKTVNFISDIEPDAVMHLAAYTRVDDAEENHDLCLKINCSGTENIAFACRKCDAKMLYISTDYVFDGTGCEPWNPADAPNPLNVYGKSKFLGEKAISENIDRFFIVRVSWVFGKNGKNFVKTMLRLGSERDSISVVSDQVGSPTYTVDLSRLLADMIVTEKYGFYHATNDGFCSWYEFASEIMNISGIQTKIIPVSSDDFQSTAKRPLNSRMSKDKLCENGFAPLPHWKDALERFLDELKEQ